MSGRRRDLPRVLAVAASAWPYGGEGESAEAAGALAARLAVRGHEVDLVLPDGAAVRRSELARGKARREVFQVQLGELVVRGELWRTSGREDQPVWVVAQDELFGLRANDPSLGAWRSAFLCAAALAVARRGEHPAEVLHLHGAETALAAVLLSTTHAQVAALASTRTVFAVHDPANLALFGRDTLDKLGLPPGLFHPQLLEHQGSISLLKAGLVFSDAIVFPSPRAAREALRHGTGYGLEGLLAEREDDLSGIFHGVEETLWNPTHDPHIAQEFSAAKLAGKARCKASLRAELGLDGEAKAPLLGFIGDLDAAAGADLLLDAMPALLRQNARLAILGSASDPELQSRWQAAAQLHPGRVAVAVVDRGEPEWLGLVHRVLAGSDVLLLPARADASGGMALRALRYGVLPVAHAVGGLAEALSPEGLGLLFRAASGRALERAVARLLEGFGTAAWKAQVRAAMEHSVSWVGAARRYGDLYKALAKREPRRIAVAALPAEHGSEPYLDWGPAPPESYDEDAVGLLVQGPRSLYAYWEVSAATLASLPDNQGEGEKAAGQASLRLVLEADGSSHEVASVVGERGEIWLAAEPGHGYVVELCSAQGATILRSALVETPRETPSEHLDVEWVRHAPRLERAPERAATEPEPPQTLYHFGSQGMVGRFGPSAWQLAASGNWEALDRDFEDAAPSAAAERRKVFAGSSGLAPERQ
jgi:starch synthase